MGGGALPSKKEAAFSGKVQRKGTFRGDEGKNSLVWGEYKKYVVKILNLEIKILEKKRSTEEVGPRETVGEFLGRWGRWPGSKGAGWGREGNLTTRLMGKGCTGSDDHRLRGGRVGTQKRGKRVRGHGKGL